MTFQIFDRSSAPDPNRPRPLQKNAPLPALSARRSEEYAFCIGISPVCDGPVTLSFGDLCGRTVIPADAFFSVNFGGRDYRGRPFFKEVTAHAKEVTYLWISLRVPEDADGVYTGELTLCCKDDTAKIPLCLTVEGDAREHGFAEPEKMTRLSWLDSDLACEGGITKEYCEPVLHGDTVSILGRDISIGAGAFPAGAVSRFDKNIRVSEKKTPVLGTVELRVTAEDGTVFSTAAGEAPRVEKYGDGYRFYARADLGVFDAAVTTEVEFDGWIGVRPVLTAKCDARIRDISLSYTLFPACDGMMMGLGQRGGACPADFSYHWTEETHSNALFVGGVNGGVRCEFRGEKFTEPFVNIYYRHRKYRMSESFANPQNGTPRGVVSLHRDDDGAHVTAASGARTVRKGDVLDFGFDLLITPLKELDMNRRFRTRYYHAEDADPDTARHLGATHVIYHHAGHTNPYINYPFLTADRIRKAADAAHERGMGAKIYYTVREQSDKTCEIDPMMTLGDEIFPRPVGDQGSILWEEAEDMRRFTDRFGKDHIPAWQTDVDMSVICDGQSRISNYYIEGLRWLCDKAGIDGIYIDDTAFDRYVMRRARRVLDANGRGAADGDGDRAPRLVDLHSWNHFCRHAGYANCLNLYLPLLPYIDSVWMGEAFDHLYMTKEFWLTELVPIPYGVPGELLISDRDATDTRYRGMLFGATFRMPWIKDDVSGLWQFIEETDLKNAEMWGFWNDESPVHCDRDDVSVTMYRHPDRLVLAAASWAKETVTARLSLDLEGYDLSRAKIPAIRNFQDAAPFDGTVTLERNKGLLIVLNKAGA